MRKLFVLLALGIMGITFTASPAMAAHKGAHCAAHKMAHKHGHKKHHHKAA